MINTFHIYPSGPNVFPREALPGLCTKKLLLLHARRELRKDAFAQRRFYKQKHLFHKKLLRTEAYTQEVSTQSSFYTLQLLHRSPFTRSFCTEQLLHEAFTSFKIAMPRPLLGTDRVSRKSAMQLSIPACKIMRANFAHRTK